ncbi:MAG: hypothetical protein ACREJP_00920 [Candidatus Methylomirabilales bacterium]
MVAGIGVTRGAGMDRCDRGGIVGVSWRVPKMNPCGTLLEVKLLIFPAAAQNPSAGWHLLLGETLQI